MSTVNDVYRAFFLLKSMNLFTFITNNPFRFIHKAFYVLEKHNLKSLKINPSSNYKIKQRHKNEFQWSLRY